MFFQPSLTRLSGKLGTTEPIYLHETLFHGVLVMVTDITERVSLEKRLTLWSQVFESNGEAVFITDSNRRILTVNPAFSRITGYEPDEVIGHTPSLLSGYAGEAVFCRHMQDAETPSNLWQGEILARRKNGECFPAWAAVSPVQGNHGQPANYIVIFSDLSTLKTAEEQVRYLSGHDMLTGLMNRAQFDEHLGHLVSHARCSESAMAVMFIDIDRFKAINDALGHVVGDKLLQLAAERLSSCLRQDDIVSRRGSDEFVAALPDTGDASHIAHTAQHLLTTLSRPYCIEGKAVSITASIGIAAYPEDGDTDTELVRNAEAAMHHAKRRGRDTYQFYTRAMHDAVTAALRIEGSLRQALQERAFSLHYQPKVDIKTGVIIGAEALIRCSRPDLGLTSPADFIPVAEESGLILPMSEWVLQEACRQIRQWQQAGLTPFPVAVNLTALQFMRENVDQVFSEAVSQAHIDPRWLEIEITEGVMLKDPDKTLDVLRRLSQMGIRIAIDDFGTGFCSFNYLKRFPIDILKIDRSFVQDISSNPDDAEIVRAIISMGHALRLQVIAEGVEGEGQVAFLGRQGCDAIQGYYFSKPVPAEAFTRKLLMEWDKALP